MFLQEILLSDIRYKGNSNNKKLNVFSNIVQPMGLKVDLSGKNIVQAEVHARYFTYLIQSDHFNFNIYYI